MGVCIFELATIKILSILRVGVCEEDIVLWKYIWNSSWISDTPSMILSFHVLWEFSVTLVAYRKSWESGSLSKIPGVFACQLGVCASSSSLLCTGYILETWLFYINFWGKLARYADGNAHTETTLIGVVGKNLVASWAKNSQKKWHTFFFFFKLQLWWNPMKS